MTKKSYNPFKMWGSYVGGVIGLLLLFITGLGGSLSIMLSSFIGDFLNVKVGLLYSILKLTIPIITGFLLGWAIHSLVRAIKK